MFVNGRHIKDIKWIQTQLHNIYYRIVYRFVNRFLKNYDFNIFL